MLLWVMGQACQPSPAEAASTLVINTPLRVTLGGSDVQTEIVIPPGTRRLRVRFETNAGAYATVGSDGGSLGSHYLTIDADSWFDIRPYCSGAYGSTVKRDGCSIYLSSATGSTVVQLQATESDG